MEMQNCSFESVMARQRHIIVKFCRCAMCSMLRVINLDPWDLYLQCKFSCSMSKGNRTEITYIHV